MGEAWTEAHEKGTLKTMVKVLCSARSPLDNVQTFLEPALLIFVSLFSAWIAVHVGMALCDVGRFLHTAKSCC